MSALSAGLSLIGGVIQAQGAMQQAKAAAKAHEFNAEVADRNTVVLSDQQRIAVQDRYRENMRTMAAIKGKFAANGITSTGSSMDVVMDTYKEMDLGIRRIQYQGAMARVEQQDTAMLERMGADAAMKAGSISAAAAILGGLTGAVSAIGGSGGFSGFGGGGGSGNPAFAGSYSGGFTSADTQLITTKTQGPTAPYAGYIPGGYGSSRQGAYPGYIPGGY